MTLSIAPAEEADAGAIASLRTAAADHLTGLHGRGHWSAPVGERSVLRSLTTARLLVAREGDRIIGTLALAMKKPWAIDPAYFTTVRRPVYLLDMAVAPDAQRQGVGRQLLEDAIERARGWPRDAIRLDAYDAPAGAGPFYATCGFQNVGRVIYRGVPLLYFERVL